jgi:hypothetical protein
MLSIYLVKAPDISAVVFGCSTSPELRRADAATPLAAMFAGWYERSKVGKGDFSKPISVI